MRPLLSALLLLPLAGLAELTPTGPIENFNLPRFGPTGVKEWQMAGKTAKFGAKTSDPVTITGLSIVTYDPPATPGAAPVARQTFSSPTAQLYPNEQRADSEDVLNLAGPGYKLTGKKWSWKREAGANRIEIKAKARLEIGLDLSNSLIPATPLVPNNPNPIVPPAREIK